MPPPQQVCFIGGRIAGYLPFWRSLTSDTIILNIVTGYKLEFENGYVPIQSSIPPPIVFSHTEQTAVADTITALLVKGVVKVSMFETGQIVHNVFVRPKRDGEFRMILNLRPLNRHIQYHKFKMTTFKAAAKLIGKDCFMASCDIKDAYFSVKIHDAHQKFLKFYWQDTLYQFTCLPQGLASAPRVFTKLLKPVLARLSSLGHTVVAYIDDLLIIAETESLCLQAIKDTCQVLEQCGFVLHGEPKCVLKPTHELEFLGFIINSSEQTVTLPVGKKERYIEACKQLLCSDTVSIRFFSQIIGMLISTFDAVQFGPLHYRHLEKDKIEALHFSHGNYDASMIVSKLAKDELQWWVSNLPSAYNRLIREGRTLELFTDATILSWGAVCEGIPLSGFFTSHEQEQLNLNINACELLAVKLAIESLLNIFRGCNVLVRSDNVTAVAYINHMGGTKSSVCNALAQKIWQTCIQADIWLSASHIPGHENVEADFQSRHLNLRTEWSLNQSIFDQLCLRYGTPEIDLFASRTNAKLNTFVSWHPEPGAFHVDAFSMSWKHYYVYVFPPFSLLSRIAQKLAQEKVIALVLLPWWPTQPWFTALMNMLVSIPTVLPAAGNLLQIESVSPITHPMGSKLKMLACKLSGIRSQQEAFRQTLPPLSWLHGNGAQKSNTAATLKNGTFFVVAQKLVQPIPL